MIVWEQKSGQEPGSGYLASVATVGGALEFIMDVDCSHDCNLTRDGEAFATFARDKNLGDMYNVEISDPLGSPLRPYAPAPFATSGFRNTPRLSFSPDGKRIVLIRAQDNGKEDAWLLPYPPGGNPPRQILRGLPDFQSAPQFGWMPDSRHIVLALATDFNSPTHLWMADTESDDLSQLTTGNEIEAIPNVAPDGRSLIYAQRDSSLDVVSVSVEDGSENPVVATGRDELMAAWSAKANKLAWVTNRGGPYEVWVRASDGSERPVVTAADFSDGRSKFLLNPALSPDGDRLIFTRADVEGVIRLWMVSLAGGSSVRLTNDERGGEFSSTWSPDGSRFAYLQTRGGDVSLMTVKTSGSATPSEIRQDVLPYLPDWSPAGDWITYRDDAGRHLTSPDGKTTKFLGKIDSDYLTFSRDGKLLYGIQIGETEQDRGRATLFSLDPVTLKRKVIKELGRDLRPDSNFRESTRFSLAPDGKSLVYSTFKFRWDLWMLQGYRQPGWLSRFSGIWK
jgi:Tol biopolymer transport system component